MARNLEVIGFTYSLHELSTEQRWLFIAKHPKAPEATWPALATQSQQIQWATEQLSAANIVESCHISLSCLGEMPWLKLHLPKGSAGLAMYWSGLLVKSVMIVGSGPLLNLHSGERGLSARFFPLADMR